MSVDHHPTDNNTNVRGDLSFEEHDAQSRGDDKYMAHITVSAKGLTCWGHSNNLGRDPSVTFDGVIIDSHNPFKSFHAFLRGRYLNLETSATAGLFQTYLEAVAVGAIGEKRSITAVLVNIHDEPIVLEVNVSWLLAMATHAYFTNNEEFKWISCIQEVLATLVTIRSTPLGKQAYAPFWTGMPIETATARSTLEHGNTPLIRKPTVYRFSHVDTIDAMKNIESGWGFDFGAQMKSPMFRYNDTLPANLMMMSRTMVRSEVVHNGESRLKAAMAVDFNRERLFKLSSGDWFNFLFESVLGNYNVPESLVKLIGGHRSGFLKFFNK